MEFRLLAGEVNHAKACWPKVVQEALGSEDELKALARVGPPGCPLQLAEASAPRSLGTVVALLRAPAARQRLRAAEI